MHTDTIVQRSIVVLAIIALGILVACGGVASPQPTQPPSGDGAALLEQRCTACHGLDRVTSAQKTAQEWEQTVTRMVGKGANLNEDEQATLIAHLAETYGP